jgi:hypothetical protein
MSSNCSGCLSDCERRPTINRKAKETCPCMNCLVKTTCSDICFDFYDYVLERNDFYPKKGVAVFRTTIDRDGNPTSSCWDDDRTKRLKENERTM